MLIFQPAAAVLNRLRYPQKFGLISLLFALPLLYVMQQFLHEVNASITLADKERMGTAYLRPLRYLLEPTSDYLTTQSTRHNSPGLLNAAVERQIHSRFQALHFQEQTHGIELDTPRQYQTLYQDWQACAPIQTSTNPAQAHVLHDRLRGEVLALISHVGDTSTLILDPDLDSYYTMNAVVVDLPTCASLILQARNFEETIDASTPLTNPQQAHILVLAGQLQQSCEAVAHDYAISASNNPSGILKPRLKPYYKEVSITHQTLARLLAVRGGVKTFTMDDRALLVQACRNAQKANLQLWNQAIDTLDDLLTQRAALYAQRRTRAEVFALGMSLIVAYLYAAFYVAVMRTVSNLEVAACRMRDNDISQSVLLASESHDELAQVVHSFNTVALRLRHEWKQAQEDKERAAQAEERYRAIVENAIEGIFQTTAEGRYLSANPALARIYGYDTPEQLMDALTIIGTQLYVDSSRRTDFAHLLETQRIISHFESEVRRKDGSHIWIAENARAVRNCAGDVLYYEGSVTDITQRKQAELALLESEARYRSVVEQVKEVIFTADVDGRWTFLNPAWADITGYAIEASLGQSFLHFIHEEDRSRHCSLFEPLLQQEKDYSHHEVRCRTCQGSVRWVEVRLQSALDTNGTLKGFFGTLTDITDRKCAEERLHHQALHDALTGLPNRLLFQDRLSGALMRAQRVQAAVAVLFVDLDNFKVINDSMGHEAGDILLKQIAARLQAVTRAGDTVARMGGDEFTLLLEGLRHVEEATMVAERIVTQLQQPISIGEREVFASASVGIVYSAASTDNPESLLRDADTAMYNVKTSGKSGYILFDASMNAGVQERLEIETGLRFALERNELRVQYQPLINLEDGHMAGVEALVRWEHPTLGMIAPGRFISIAEETGLIIPMGYWVLEEACRQMQAWKAAHPDYGTFTVNVNLSGKQLLRADVVERVQDILLRTGIEPGNVNLEITESVMMADVKDAITKLTGLKSLGLTLAMDDFGTGYSSIASLNLFPLDTVKIDRSFVARLADQEEAQAVIAAIVMLSKALNLNVTGEGIETKEQLVHLQGLGCHVGQGYYFDKPLSPQALEERMANCSTPCFERQEMPIKYSLAALREAA